MSEEKIKIGVKGKDCGFMFYPYINVLTLKLPLKFIGLDKNNKPIYRKTKRK